MSLFSQPSFGSAPNTSFGAGAATGTIANPNKDFEVPNPSDDSISTLTFSPPSLPTNFLVAGSWDNNVRCWEITANAQAVPKAQQTMGGPILDTCWHDDGSKVSLQIRDFSSQCYHRVLLVQVFMASCDKQVKCWDLASNQAVQVAEHQAPVKACRWVKAPNYSALMTASWDKTIKFWDVR